MAFYGNPLHRRNSYDHIELVSEGDNDKTALNMDTFSDDISSDKVNVFISFVFILELLVLIFVSVLEYFLRSTSVFPVHERKFNCADPDLSYVIDDGGFGDFAYEAEIPWAVIVSLCFCLPPFIILLSEIALWSFTDERQKTVRALCKQCRLPQVLRRIVRFIGAFLFGLLITMVFTDVIKLFVGRHRPIFLDMCKPNATACASGGTFDSSICLEENSDKVRDAKLSFPSLHASMSAFAATYIAVYLHNVIRMPSVRIMRPFLSLSFLILAVMCGLVRYGRHYSHWTDVAAGFALGVIFAVYIGVFVLDNFRERMNSQRLYSKLKSFLAEQRVLELKDLYKENWDRLERSYYGYPSNAGYDGHTGGLVIPRAHLHGNPHTNESATDPDVIGFPTDPLDDRHRKPQNRDTFQRDLHRHLHRYKREPIDAYSNHI